MISITGYVTETHGKEGFTIKITDDTIPDDKGKYPEFSKEARITINQSYYPSDSFYNLVNRNDPRELEINRCISISEGSESAAPIQMVKGFVPTKPPTSDD